MRTEHSICSDCAKRLNGEWPDGHVATFHVYQCEFCLNEEDVTSTRNYRWPDGIRPEPQYEGMENEK